MPDGVGVERGLRGAGEAGVLTAGVVRTARVLPMGVLARAAFQGDSLFPSLSHLVPVSF